MTGKIPARAGRLLTVAFGAIALFAIVAATAGAATINYNNFPKPLPGNVQSTAFQATSAAEFGGQVGLTGAVTNPKITVGLSSWACQTGSATDGTCVSAPGSTFNVPITLNVYQVGAGNTVGSKIVTLTQNFAVPYRPTADVVHCTTGGWFDAKKKGGGCFHGLLSKITFAKLGNTKAPLTLPSNVIISVAFNTFTHGYAPTGVEGPYDSLNVGLTEGAAVAPSVGSNPVPADTYYNSTFGPFYCDEGAGGTGTFRLDAGCHTGEQPLIEVKST